MGSAGTISSWSVECRCSKSKRSSSTFLADSNECPADGDISSSTSGWEAQDLYGQISKWYWLAYPSQAAAWTKSQRRSWQDQDVRRTLHAPQQHPEPWWWCFSEDLPIRQHSMRQAKDGCQAFHPYAWSSSMGHQWKSLVQHTQAADDDCRMVSRLGRKCQSSSTSCRYCKPIRGLHSKVPDLCPAGRGRR